RDPRALALPAVGRAAGAEADAVRPTAGQQRLDMPRVADLGHVRQVVRGRHRVGQGRLQPTDIVRLERFTGNTLAAPLLGAGLLAGSWDFQAAAAQVAVLDAGAFAEFGG